MERSESDICGFLPLYEKIRSLLDFFFEDNVLFEISDILNKQKILKDFSTGFIPDKLATASGRRVTNLCPAGKTIIIKLVLSS
ncbi:BAQ_1a_G0017750.mRNA.1.CDS.1 [Saccharomyces cerevisiae]|nr:BAQ_1a_G0017750.mRNA.1.CDS.1 [Saccharomyces cerevisiae]CAI7111489.1 BAQ_1a_G0017750.mRNA.1.CDS.1 [Saccharomyces cerevisiae]